MGYTPSLVSETTVPQPWKLCVMAAGAMLLDKQTRGGIKVDIRKMAAAALIGLYPEGGVSLTQLKTAFRFLGQPLNIQRYTTFPKIVSWGRSGRGMVVLGNYWKLDAAYRLQRKGATKWDGSHAIYVDRIEGNTVYFMDPLQKSGGLRTMPLTELSAYARGFSQSGAISVAVEDTATSGTLGAWGDLITFPVGHILTTTDIDDMIAKLETAGWFSKDPTGSAKAIVRGILAMHVGEPWNKALQDTLQSQFEKASGLAGTKFNPLNEIDPLKGIVDALAFIMDPQNWVRVFAFLIGLALISAGGKMVLDASVRAV